MRSEFFIIAVFANFLDVRQTKLARRNLPYVHAQPRATIACLQTMPLLVTSQFSCGTRHSAAPNGDANEQYGAEV